MEQVTSIRTQEAVSLRLAKQCRTLAQMVSYGPHRETLLRQAEDYERIARHIATVEASTA